MIMLILYAEVPIGVTLICCDGKIFVNLAYTTYVALIIVSNTFLGHFCGPNSAAKCTSLHGYARST